MPEPGEIGAKLRRWPRRITPDQRSLAAECLERCCDLFDATQALLLIDDGDEPWLNIASRSKDEFRWREDEHLRLESVVAAELAPRSFYVGARDQVRFADARARHVARAVHPRIRKEIGRGPILSVPIVAESLQGRLFISAPKLDLEAALLIAEPLSTVLAIQFEASSQLRTTVRDAVDQERVRVARDLHDGLLQSFTGVVLQLETVHSMLDNDPQNARRVITETQGLIMSDQRELRRYVEQLRPRPLSGETKFDFAERLEDLRSRFASQWGISLVFDVTDVDPVISGFIGQETFRLIHEAVTNSAKHGRASVVRVGVHTVGSEMHIEVADNGTGFPFHGRLTLDEMRESRTGPTVLAERVSSLNGTLTVDSTESGAVVTMTVPLGFGA
ncbi:MAG TPA: histidine kinase [Thermoanaerobaculia bacterium]|jgi:signal transduction histidine kinase|nr:histidine kinase [Thermoanaerobaculia bacterium]